LLEDDCATLLLDFCEEELCGAELDEEIAILLLDFPDEEEDRLAKEDELDCVTGHFATTEPEIWAQVVASSKYS
jgi:hypothetical protein